MTEEEKLKLNLEHSWLDLGDVTKIQRDNPLASRTEWDRENPGLSELRALRNSDYLSYAVKVFLGIDLLPIQAVILEELWHRPFPMYIASRGFGKTFLLAVYALMKCLLVPETKVVIVGAAFRQAKYVFEYAAGISQDEKADVFRDVLDSRSAIRIETDRLTYRINDSLITAIPIGDGSKIRGMRATNILADEFNSIPPSIYETVIAGFGAVARTPVENVKEVRRRKMLKEYNLWSQEQEAKYLTKNSNQAILSGTCGYEFEHFAEYWKKHRAIVLSGGDPHKLEEIPGHDERGFDWKDYSIIRIPYEMVPEGFMEDKTVARAKATMHSGIYAKEYGAVFTRDSDGFFRRGLIESCVANEKNIENPHWQRECVEPYTAMTKGNYGKTYVYGIDPASEQDNFTISVLEVWPSHQRVVCCWSTNRKNFNERMRAGLTKGKKDFYGFCARKIRELMTIFPLHMTTKPGCGPIGIDAQGGGRALMEALHDPDKMEEGEQPIWEIIDPDKEKDTDHNAGLHIVELIQFAKADWTSAANNGLKKDMEDRVLLFPEFDPVILGLAVEEDLRHVKAGHDTRIYDSLESAMLEIEEMKDEMSTITMTRTGTGVNGRDRWDTPEIKLEGQRKGRLRKDRYSALIIANMMARQIQRTVAAVTYKVVGGFSHQVQGRGGKMYDGPEWFTQGTNQCEFYGRGIRRGV